MAYPKTTKQKSPLVYPHSTSVKGVDRKFDLCPPGSGIRRSGALEHRNPTKTCHTICIQVWCEVERAKILLRGVAGFIGITSSLVSLLTYWSSKHTVPANQRESCEDFWFPMFLWPTLTQPSKKVHCLPPFDVGQRGRREV